jgi:sulfur carrier protein ThiS
MKVNIKLLGTYRRYLPSGSQGAVYTLEVPDATVIETLLDQVAIPPGDGYVVLVNGRTPLAGQILEEGDTVTLFPAMAGG